MFIYYKNLSLLQQYTSVRHVHRKQQEESAELKDRETGLNGLYLPMQITDWLLV